MSFYADLPAGLQEIVQNGLLERVFQDALVPEFLFDTLAEVKPWGGQMGSQSIMTRAGLMLPSTSPVTGSDAPLGTYGFEQYSLFMEQYGNSIDTNMAVSAQALASKFLEDNRTLGINAGQSINRIARDALYSAYNGGNTWVATAASASTTLVVNSAVGFDKAQQIIPGTTTNSSGLNVPNVPQYNPVSASNPLHVTINGVANTVIGVDLATNTLTLGTAVTAAPNQDVIAVTAPVSYRPNARYTAADLVSGDIATLSLFESAVTRLRASNVPTINGAYTAHVSPQTWQELFQDPAFQRVYTGRSDSPTYRNFSLSQGRFIGIDWIMNNELPVATTPGGLPIYQPIVAGNNSLIKGPFSEMANLVTQLNAGSTVQIDMIDGVARILRAPLDRFGQILSSTWSWIGGYAVGTDMLTGDSATFKRAVVLQHV